MNSRLSLSQRREMWLTPRVAILREGWGLADHVNEGSGEEESASPTRTTHDRPTSWNYPLTSPLDKVKLAPSRFNYFHARNQLSSVWQLMKLGLTKRKWTKEKRICKERSTKNPNKTNLPESRTAVQVTTEQSASLPSTAGTEENVAVEEEIGRDKEKFCDYVPSRTLRYLMFCVICPVRRFSKRITTWPKLPQ